jgi:hypothetical protein
MQAEPEMDKVGTSRQLHYCQYMCIRSLAPETKQLTKHNGNVYEEEDQIEKIELAGEYRSCHGSLQHNELSYTVFYRMTVRDGCERRATVEVQARSKARNEGTECQGLGARNGSARV